MQYRWETNISTINFSDFLIFELYSYTLQAHMQNYCNFVLYLGIKSYLFNLNIDFKLYFDTAIKNDIMKHDF